MRYNRLCLNQILLGASLKPRKDTSVFRLDADWILTLVDMIIKDMPFNQK